MMNSELVDYVKLSPNNSGNRTDDISRITPHCVVGQCTIEALGDLFANPKRMASSNYGIDRDARVGLFVNENCRSWCSSSNANDQKAVTIECASYDKYPYWFNDVVWDKLIALCVDICYRNKKEKLIWIPEKEKALTYKQKTNEMLITVHRWFANTECPGKWAYDKLPELANAVTNRLSQMPTKVNYMIKVLAQDIPCRRFPSFNSDVTQYIKIGSYTIVEEKNNFGKLKSGVGWIYLGDYIQLIK